MPGLVLDTHTALWYLELNPRLSATALGAIRQTLAQGERCLVASISLVETTYRLEKGRIPQPLYRQLIAALGSAPSNLTIAPLDFNVARSLEQVSRMEVPDLPDRVIAATTLALGLPLVTRTGRIRASGVEIIW